MILTTDDGETIHVGPEGRGVCIYVNDESITLTPMQALKIIGSLHVHTLDQLLIYGEGE